MPGLKQGFWQICWASLASNEVLLVQERPLVTLRTTRNLGLLTFYTTRGMLGCVLSRSLQQSLCLGHVQAEIVVCAPHCQVVHLTPVVCLVFVADETHPSYHIVCKLGEDIGAVFGVQSWVSWVKRKICEFNYAVSQLRDHCTVQGRASPDSCVQGCCCAPQSECRGCLAQWWNCHRYGGRICKVSVVECCLWLLWCHRTGQPLLSACPPCIPGKVFWAHPTGSRCWEDLGHTGDTGPVRWTGQYGMGEGSLGFSALGASPAPWSRRQ